MDRPEVQVAYSNISKHVKALDRRIMTSQKAARKYDRPERKKESFMEPTIGNVHSMLVSRARTEMGMTRKQKLKQMNRAKDTDNPDPIYDVLAETSVFNQNFSHFQKYSFSYNRNCMQ